MIMINTGDGKGKTTAAVGQVIRALSRDWKVCMIQLFKGEEFYGEQKILTQLENLELLSYAPRHPYCCPETAPESARHECAAALERLREIVREDRHDLIVLEEFNIALREGYMDLHPLLEVLDSVDERRTVLITGRDAPQGLVDRADLVTEMKEIKHPYRNGTAARRGIEF